MEDDICYSPLTGIETSLALAVSDDVRELQRRVQAMEDILFPPPPPLAERLESLFYHLEASIGWIVRDACQELDELEKKIRFDSFTFLIGQAVRLAPPMCLIKPTSSPMLFKQSVGRAYRYKIECITDEK